MFLMMRTDPHHPDETWPLDLCIAIDEQRETVVEVSGRDVPSGLDFQERCVGGHDGADGPKKALSSGYIPRTVWRH